MSYRFVDSLQAGPGYKFFTMHGHKKEKEEEEEGWTSLWWYTLVFHTTIF